MKMEKTECSETSAYKIQMPGNYPEKKHKTSLFYIPTKVVNCVVLRTVLCANVYCTVLLPPGDNPVAVNKYIDININI